MTRQVLQNTTRPFKVYMVEDADNKTPVTGLVGSFTVMLAKSGLPESAVAPTIAERGNGWYEVTPLAAHRDTLGESAWTFSGGTAAVFPRLEEVVAFDSQDAADLGLSQLALIEAMRGTDGAALASAWTATRAGYIDHLSAGPIATQASVDSIQNSVRSSLVVPKEYPLPESGTQRFRIDLWIYSPDDVGMEDPDGNLVTITVKNAAGVDRSGNLYLAASGGFPTSFMARDGVGQFHAYYEIDSADPVEQLNFKVAYGENGNAMVDGNSTVIVAVPNNDGATVSGFDVAALKQLFSVNVNETPVSGSVVQASQGAAGGDVSVDSFTANALQQLSAIKVVLMSLLDPKSKTLVLVQNKDYTSTSAIGPLRIQIDQPGILVGDAVRLGMTLPGGVTRDVTGTVIDDAGTLYGQVELTKEEHTNVPADNYGKYEFEHINGAGEVSPLLADQRLIVLASHPN